MRLFWKLFCSMVTITALACSIGGFVLIDGQFRAGLDAQAELVTTENTLLRRTLLRQMQFSRTFTRRRRRALPGMPPPRKAGTACAFASATVREPSWPGTAFRQSPL